MDLIVSYPQHLQLPKCIDDNDDAFRLNTEYLLHKPTIVIF